MRRQQPVGVWIALAALLLGSVAHGEALEQLRISRDGEVLDLAGQIIVEAEDGGVLLLDPAGVLWAVTPDELVERERSLASFVRLDAAGMSAAMMDALPPGFRTHKTAHYLICHNTSAAYAKWCGSLFERLYLAFRTYWRRQGMELTDPDWPLVAIIFGNKDSYERYAQHELGEAADSIVGYYSLRSNRVAMYDLSGLDSRQAGRSARAQIRTILSRPETERMIATIVHEATHQLAFNSGLQTRYADIPLWVSEGIAVYFETPDLQSARGWRNIGAVNRVRLADFRRYLPQRPTDSLTSLIASDDRFRNTRSAADAYGEAWALNYFLLRKHKAAYIRYLKTLAAKRPLLYDKPADRLAAFRAAFGEDLRSLDAEFLRAMDEIYRKFVARG